MLKALLLSDPLSYSRISNIIATKSRYDIYSKSNEMSSNTLSTHLTGVLFLINFLLRLLPIANDLKLEEPTDSRPPSLLAIEPEL